MIDVVVLTMGTLIFLILLQQYTIQKLLNKLMSRNFHEYENAISLNKKLDTENNVNLSPETPEDIRALQEFGFR